MADDSPAHYLASSVPAGSLIIIEEPPSGNSVAYDLLPCLFYGFGGISPISSRTSDPVGMPRPPQPCRPGQDNRRLTALEEPAKVTGPSASLPVPTSP